MTLFLTRSLQGWSCFSHSEVNYVELDEKLDRFIKAVDLRLGEIKRQLKEQRRADERILEDFNLPPNLSHVGTGILPQPQIDESAGHTRRVPDIKGQSQ